jgi:hypothetical protein
MMKTTGDSPSVIRNICLGLRPQKRNHNRIEPPSCSQMQRRAAPLIARVDVGISEQSFDEGQVA